MKVHYILNQEKPIYETKWNAQTVMWFNELNLKKQKNPVDWETIQRVTKFQLLKKYQGEWVSSQRKKFNIEISQQIE